MEKEFIIETGINDISKEVKGYSSLTVIRQGGGGKLFFSSTNGLIEEMDNDNESNEIIKKEDYIEDLLIEEGKTYSLKGINSIIRHQGGKSFFTLSVILS